MMKTLLPMVLAGWGAMSLNGVADSDFYRDGDAPPKVFSIGRMAKPPVLDGNLADWPSNTASFLLGQNSQIGRRFAWGGTKDASGSILLAWDKDYLYLGADVIDDQLSQAVSGAEPWQGDTFELFFNIFPRQQRLDGFWQEAIMPPLVAGAKLKVTGPQKDFLGVEGTAKVHPGGYTFEGRIPWKNLTGFRAVAGTSLGFQLYLDDRDGTGRKSQLFWYPSAISFSHPTHTNIILLREQGDTASPKVLAGPATWLTNDPANMAVSAITDVAGAKSATITVIPPFPNPSSPAPEATATFELQPLGERASVGEGTVPVTGLEGLYNFAVHVTGSHGETLAANTFQAQIQGAKFQRMRALFDSLKKRAEALKSHPGLDEKTLAGIVAWNTRVNNFIFNEARPEAINRELLDQILMEYGAMDHALTALESGGDPYAGQTGSLVRAYRSPLTGNFRAYAVEVPAGYDPAKKYPLIILLHSIFADERALSAMASSLRDLGAIVYQGAAYGQFDWGGVSAAETWAGLDEVKKTYSIDEDRVYLFGCHIGGRGTWQLAEARPDQWAAIAPLFSGIDTMPNYPALQLYPEFFGEAAHPQIPNAIAPSAPASLTDPLLRRMYEQDSLVTRLDNIATIPMVSSYGEDEPNAAAERMAMQNRLQTLGAPLATHYVPGAMHGSPAEEFTDPTFYRWLLSFHRPSYPMSVHYVVTGLRDHAAWWVSIDQMTSPSDTASIEAKREGGGIAVTTHQASAISLLIDTRLAATGTTLEVNLDGQTLKPLQVTDNPTWVHFVKSEKNWTESEVPAGDKHPGSSGPINDFQRDRFLIVYGTGGTDAEKASLEREGKSLSDWGLGAVFSVKADRDVTDSDIQDATLLLVGAPANNSILAKMADRLPLKWTAKGMTLGDRSVEGPGAGACVITPDPLAPTHYAVILTATDDGGYQIWNVRDPGGDYVLGQTGKTGFAVTARGWFNNQWKWADDLCLKP